ncbi:MAG: GNAT family N-acetyltransferase [Terasakiella sp.]|uniref:GNAT family N-acetyltransferase n=1 Tax=unclassified Terasakiella TaxID=2614952 RepID=UPI003B00A1E9
MVTVFRRAWLSDLDALQIIEEKCFLSDRLSRRQLRYHLRGVRNAVFVACMDEQVVGYALCLCPPNDRPARLHSLAVLPLYRGKGLASRLIEKVVLDVAQKGYGRLRLEVRKNDPDTVALYQKFGFLKIDDLPVYYGDGADAWRLQRSL